VRRLAQATRFTTVMALLASLSACVTGVDRVATDFAPNDTEGLVYGRMELFVNEGAVKPDQKRGEVMSFLRNFTGTDNLVRPGLAESPGTLRIDARVTQGGDFIAKLPVGRYYFDHFVYIGLVERPRGALRGIVDWCTYSNSGYTTVSEPILVTFDVLPNRATYIGTLRHRVRIDDPYAILSTNINFGLEMKNEFASDTKRILAPYTKLQHPAEMDLAQVQVLSTPVFKPPRRPANR